jgi:succinoglycan biosynthesis transport protein ExoP
MEILFFLKVLLRRLYIIVPICLLAMAATFLMYKNEPKVYTSSALMATGIINVEEGSAGWVQEYKVMNDFNNLITLMLSRESIQTLSQSLVKRDLASESPYRRSDDIGKYLSPAEIVTLVKFLEAPKNDTLKQHSDEQTLTFRNHTNNIAKALGYDEAALRKSIAIERLKDSDFIRVQFTSDNPQLSALAANTLCNNFIAEFTRQKNEKSDNSADFYRNLAEQKKNELNAKTESLEKFKLNSQVSNLEQQTKATLEQIRELEMQKQRAKEKIPSYEKTLNSLDGYMAQDQQTVRSTKTNNKRITDLQDQIKAYNDEYISSGYKKTKAKEQAERLRRELETEVRQNSRNEESGSGSVGGTVAESRRDLLNRKLDTEKELEEARASVGIIDNEIGRLKGSVSGLVSKEATIASYEREIKILSEEYLALTEKLNAAEFTAINAKSNQQQLQIHEKALAPESPEASKAPFMTLLAGIATFVLSTFVLLGLVYMDNRLLSPFQLKKHTGLPLLEVLNTVNVKDLDLDQIFNKANNKPEYETFKQLVRNMRYKLLALGETQTILFSSLKAKEGKTFCAVTLAYALSLNNKSVLLLDCNFKNNTITRLSTQSMPVNPGLEKMLQQTGLERVFGLKGKLFDHIGGYVDVLGCRTDENSASELLSGKNFRALLTQLQQNYDHIIMESAAMNDYTDTKELCNYSDKVIAVIAADQAVNSTDQSSIDFLHKLGTKFAGVVLNMTDMRNLS